VRFTFAKLLEPNEFEKFSPTPIFRGFAPIDVDFIRLKFTLQFCSLLLYFDMIFLVSPTASRDPKYDELLEDIGDQHYDDLSNEVVEEIIQRMDAHRDEFTKKRKPHYLIIFDDCIHAMRGKKSRAMDRLATQNRHLQVSNWYATQKWNSYLPTLVRSNLDCIGFWRTGNKKELDSFLDEMNDDETKLRALYQYATEEPYSFLWINQYHGKPLYFKKFDRIDYRKKLLE
jgi:hypothetical protein